MAIKLFPKRPSRFVDRIINPRPATPPKKEDK